MNTNKRLTSEDVAIWSRFNDEPSIYGGALRTTSREQDCRDYTVMLDEQTNGQGIPLNGAVRNL